MSKNVQSNTNAEAWPAALVGLPCLLSWGLTSWKRNLRQGESYVLGEENTAVRWEEGVFCLVEILVQNWGSFLQWGASPMLEQQDGRTGAGQTAVAADGTPPQTGAGSPPVPLNLFPLLLTVAYHLRCLPVWSQRWDPFCFAELLVDWAGQLELPLETLFAARAKPHSQSRWLLPVWHFVISGIAVNPGRLKSCSWAAGKVREQTGQCYHSLSAI